MNYENVCLEAITCTLPEERLTSEELESRLEPLYRRLRLPEGRLELMTGIRQRRLWPRGVLPGDRSILTGKKLLEVTGFPPEEIGVLIHGSVCRDFLEPATACKVHQQLGLPEQCSVYDVSNACLGLLSGMVQVANQIELGQIEAGLIVGTESSRGLLEATIDHLNTEMSLTRKNVKPAFASLTIGSGSAAILLTHRDRSRTGNRLLGGVTRANTSQCHLCRSDTDRAGGDAMNPLMWTDSEMLMQQGVATAKVAFDDFLDTLGWSREAIDKTFCHQVGRAHQKLLFEQLRLPLDLNFSTLEYLGNTGAVALPTAASLGIQSGFLESGDRVALLGIGSGINVVMLGIEWRKSLIDPDFSHEVLDGVSRLHGLSSH
jgi:3-oxoacyl-[acyl-carrier-protein] synthase-3